MINARGVLAFLKRLQPNRRIYELYLICCLIDCRHARMHADTLTGTRYYVERNDVLDDMIFPIVEWGTVSDNDAEYLDESTKSYIATVCVEYSSYSARELNEEAIREIYKLNS